MARVGPDAIARMGRQIQRWTRAAIQDADPGVKFLHASYAVSVLDMLRQLAADDEIRRVTGIQVLALQESLAGLQDQAQAELLGRRGP